MDTKTLAGELYDLLDDYPELEPGTHNLSITTFRYVPEVLASGGETIETYLNDLNAEILTELQESGEMYISNAVVGGVYLLRMCIVNFRTTHEDIEALPPYVVTLGEELDARLRPERLRS